MASGSRFFGHIKWWFFTVPVIAMCVMPAIPSPDLFVVSDEEASSVSATIGAARADEATKNANTLFRRVFVDPGIVRTTLQATSASEVNDAGASDFARTWVRHFWMLVYRAVYRLTVMKLWLLGTVAFGVAAFVDGTVRRKIKAAAAGFVSPLSFHLAAHGILLVFGVTLSVLIVPVPVLAEYWIGVAVCLALLLWKAASSYQ
ncbi:MAG: DUF4400 domain-containing protein [Paraburkholderia sp.]|uniref:DUF4400 domain-containing protein n=1 Tax=Burkholderiaceae TaxID=119060 RepID=UPI0010F6D4B6|nr:DUF4400 domain-containing protein [Burkholderia sp. 4M9327F10]